MLAVDLVIDLGHILVIVLIGGNVVGDLTARVGKHTNRRHTLGKLAGDVERRCCESRGIHRVGSETISAKGRRQWRRATTGGRFERPKVAFQHVGSGKENNAVVRARPLRGALEAAEEKQLVLLDGPADGAAKIVALVGAVLGRQVFSGAAKGVVADELKQVAMEAVGARRRHHFDRRRVAARGSQPAGLDFEFLYRIRKGERQGCSGHEIVVAGAIQDPVRRAAAQRQRSMPAIER